MSLRSPTLQFLSPTVALVVGAFTGCGPSEGPPSVYGTPFPSDEETTPPTALTCAPTITPDTSSFEITYDDEFHVYLRMMMSYSLVCGELTGGRVALTLHDTSREEADTYDFFLEANNPRVTFDLSGARVGVDAPLDDRDPEGTFDYTLQLFDSLGYASEVAEGTIDLSGDATATPTE